MDKFLQQLAERLQIYDADVVSADELADWPDGLCDKLVTEGILKEIEHAKGVICDQCEENCFIEPDIRTNPDTGEPIGVFICTRNPDIGRIEVNLDQARQWKIDKEKLKELGFLKKKAKRRKRRASSKLSPSEQEVYRMAYVEGKKVKQIAIELRCTDKNIYKHLRNAEKKIKAQNSRSINLSKAQALPTDKRGQVHLGVEDNEPSELGG